MGRNHSAQEAAKNRVSELLQQPAETALDLGDEPVLVAAYLLRAVIGDCRKCYFVTSDGVLKWSSLTLAECLGYDKDLAKRAAKSAFLHGGDHCGQTQQPSTPRLQALRQVMLDELRKRRPLPRVPDWGRKSESVKHTFKDMLLKSHGERIVIRDILEGRRKCPRELTAILAPIARWPEDDVRQLKRYLM